MPLTGRRIVVTRAAHQSAELTDLLREQGAIPIAYPCIAITPPTDPAALTDALRRAASGEFDWLVLTSSNAADAIGAFFSPSPASRERGSGGEGLTPPDLPAIPLPSPRLRGRGVGGEGILIAVSGSATAAQAERWLGRTPNLIPADFNAGGIADAIAPHITPGTRILMPISEIARPELSERLTALGAVVTAVTAYRTTIGGGGEDVPALLRERQIDAITFTSPSTIAHFLTRLANEGGQREDLSGVAVACIGATTAAAARDLGLSVHVVAPAQTMASLVSALENFVQ